MLMLLFTMKAFPGNRQFVLRTSVLVVTQTHSPARPVTFWRKATCVKRTVLVLAGVGVGVGVGWGPCPVCCQ